MVKEFSLSKSERLSGRKSISALFETGLSIYVPPLRLIYNLEGEGPHPVAVAVSVPKRLFKRAVDRNLLKRRIREAYRCHKKELYEVLAGNQIKLNLVIQYQQNELSSFRVIEGELIRGMKTLQEKLKKPDGSSG